MDIYDFMSTPCFLSPGVQPYVLLKVYNKSKTVSCPLNLILTPNLQESQKVLFKKKHVVRTDNNLSFWAFFSQNRGFLSLSLVSITNPLRRVAVLTSPHWESASSPPQPCGWRRTGSDYFLMLKDVRFSFSFSEKLLFLFNMYWTDSRVSETKETEPTFIDLTIEASLIGERQTR